MRHQEKVDSLDSIIKKRLYSAQDREGYLSLLRRIIILVLIIWLIFSHVFFISQIQGNNMFPAVKDGDLIVGFRLQQSYVKDDIIAFNQDEKILIGRVIAIEGDVVNMDDTGTLLVNGTTQTGEIMYPTYAKPKQSYPYLVEENQVFVLADYRTRAEDSRDFGAISLDNVEAKIITLLRRRGL